MNINKCVNACTRLMVLALMTLPVTTLAQDSRGTQPESALVKIAPKSSAEVARYTMDVEHSPYLTHDQKLELLRKKIKYVFVLFQENRSFDFYFGTYPGAHGLFSQTAANTPGFIQPIVKTDGTVGTISPFRFLSQSPPPRAARCSSTRKTPTR